MEIEIYQVAVSAATADARAYVADGAWYRNWLARLRLGSFDADSRIARRLAYYAGKSASDQRLAFSNVLAAVLPESALCAAGPAEALPPAVQIVTATAFGKPADADEYRCEQIEIQPSIADCHECHGAVLDNAQQCGACGNPLWTFNWLTAADG